MARLAEESEDDFPDLATVIRVSGASRSPWTERYRQKQFQPPKIDSGNADKINASRNLPLAKSKIGENGAKPKPRRQYLNRISDNPLLLPLNNQRSTGASTLFVKSPKFILDSFAKPNSSTRKTKTPIRHERKHIARRESPSESETTGLSDFIVDDSSYLEEVDWDEDVLPSISRPSRTPRKLMRGLRRRQVTSPSEHSLQTDTAFEDFTGFRDRSPVLAEDSSFDDCTKLKRARFPEMKTRHEFRIGSASSGTEEPSPARSYSPLEARSPKKILKESGFITPPQSPQKVKSGLISPKKVPRIPSTPHRPSMDDFWSQTVINQWNDEYSPRKTSPKAGTRLQKRDDSDFENDSRQPPGKQDPTQRKISLETKKDFNRRKQEIAVEFLAELDRAITDGKVGSMAAGTGGVKIIWSKKLNSTAGRAHWKRETIGAKTLLEGSKPGTLSYIHHASIELAEKVIDSEERLLNTLAHEFCHLANFMVSGIKNNPHGKEFKVWAAKCSTEFATRGIEVTTKHSYMIDYKYVWECTNCGVEYKRHSKSIDPARHQCGACKSKLAQTKPEPRGLGKVGDYQMFVKENMKRVREENPESPQREIMGLMGKLYQNFKATKMKEGDGADLREENPLDSVDALTRKLDFIDLTSP